MISNKNDYYEYSAPELVRMLGARFKDYRLRSNLTQREVAEIAGVSVLTIHRFESGVATNVSLATFLLVLKAVGCLDGLEALLPDLPASPYLNRANNKMPQRIRHKK